MFARKKGTVKTVPFSIYIERIVFDVFPNLVIILLIANAVVIKGF